MQSSEFHAQAVWDNKVYSNRGDYLMQSAIGQKLHKGYEWLIIFANNLTLWLSM